MQGLRGRFEPHVVSDQSVQGLARGNRYHDAGSEKVLASSLMLRDVDILKGWRDVGPRIAKGRGCESSECVRDAGSGGSSEAAARAEASGRESLARIIANVSDKAVTGSCLLAKGINDEEICTSLLHVTAVCVRIEKRASMTSSERGNRTEYDDGCRNMINVKRQSRCSDVDVDVGVPQICGANLAGCQPYRD